MLAQTPPEEAPAQPVPFSHRVHAGKLKLACKMCHQTPDPGEVMTLPTVSRCMECHSAVKTESPAIRKLAALARQGKEAEWVTVYDLPSYVKFSHQRHSAKGATCTGCHGPVEERDQIYKEVEQSMGTCMDCHRAKQATLACNACHERK